MAGKLAAGEMIAGCEEDLLQDPGDLVCDTNPAVTIRAAPMSKLRVSNSSPRATSNSALQMRSRVSHHGEKLTVAAAKTFIPDQIAECLRLGRGLAQWRQERKGRRLPRR